MFMCKYSLKIEFVHIYIFAFTFITEVTQDLPETVVALINETVFLTCDVSTDRSGDSTDLILDKAYRAGANPSSNNIFDAKNITWTCFGSDPNDDKTGYNITIIAGENNNGTTLYCVVNNDCKSRSATLTVVKGTIYYIDTHQLIYIYSIMYIIIHSHLISSTTSS